MAPRKKNKNKKVSWDPKLEPLMEHLFGSNGVTTRKSAEEGRRAVDFFRGKDFEKWITNNREHICEKVPYCEELFASETDTSSVIVTLVNELIEKGFIYRALPVSSVAASTPSSGGKAATPKTKEPEKPPPKWPKKLQPSPHQLYCENGFYVVCYEGTNIGNHALLGIIIISVLVICMFPVWPLQIKLAVWYISVVLLTILLGLIVIRVILFVFIWYFGVDFWLLPNLFNEDVGVVDSFIPAYSCDYRNDPWLMVAARLFCLNITLVGIYQLGQTHSISDVHDFATRQFLDVLDWGHQKLAPPPDIKLMQTNPIVRPKQTDENDSDNVGGTRPVEDHTEEEDYSCLRNCGFHTFEELMEECLTACPCMEELLHSSCYKACPSNVKKSLDEAKLDACAEDGDAPKMSQTANEDDEL